MRPDAAVPTTTHTYLLAEPSLPDLFKGQAKLLYVKKDNLSLGQKIKDFFLRPLMIVAAKTILLNVLQGSVFRDNKDAQNLTAHIKGLGFFEGVDEFRVKDFLADAALHGSRLPSPSGTTNKAEKSLAELTGAALNEHLNNPDYMYETLQECAGKAATGLDEFHSLQSNPSVQLSDTQINKIHLLNRHIETLKKDSEKSQLIPKEVFTKFSEIYQNFSKRLQAKDLVLSASNLIDRLSRLHPSSSNIDYFLAFFKTKNENISGEAVIGHAQIFKARVVELANTLDPYRDDASMRATLEILADEFLAHADNQDQPWATADAIKTLKQDLEKAKEKKERYWKM